MWSFFKVEDWLRSAEITIRRAMVWVQTQTTDHPDQNPWLIKYWEGFNVDGVFVSNCCSWSSHYNTDSAAQQTVCMHCKSLVSSHDATEPIKSVPSKRLLFLYSNYRPASLDHQQYAFRTDRSTEDVIQSLLPQSSCTVHVELQLNTISPVRLTGKLNTLGAEYKK